MTKTILITGATAGIRRGRARSASPASGWRVIGTGRRGDRLRALADELGDAFLPLELDMRDRDGASRPRRSCRRPGARSTCCSTMPGSLRRRTPLPETRLGAARAGASTPTSPGWSRLTRALLPKLIERKGAIINLSSVAATYPYRGGAVYAGTKAFVRQFSLDLRCDLAGTGVRVTSIEPGMAETEFTLVRTGGDQAASDALYANMDPMTAEDIADLFWWLANLPPHLNINAIELMPVSQSWAGFTVNREG